MAFAKGQSGNPGGRPRKTEEQIKFETRCREWAATMAADKLIKLTSSPNPTAQMAALKEILDRGFGKSVETSVIDAYVAPQTGVSVDELTGAITALVPGAEGAGGENSKSTGMDA